VIIAIVPAAALAYYFVNNWLGTFAYHVDISPLIFIASGGIAIVIAWLTVSFQSIKAARSNPVESLRYE
jgi:putative ABC transport system permease protein